MGQRRFGRCVVWAARLDPRLLCPARDHRSQQREWGAFQPMSDLEGAGGRDGDGGRVPPPRDQLGDVLQMEVEVWRSGGVRGPAPARAQGREREAEEAAGQGDTGQRGSVCASWRRSVAGSAIGVWAICWRARALRPTTRSCCGYIAKRTCGYAAAVAASAPWAPGHQWCCRMDRTSAGRSTSSPMP